MTGRVVTFGEVLLRLTTSRHERFSQARQFDVIYGGTESNVAVSLSHFGVSASHVTAIPDNDIGQACVNFIRQYGVDTSGILRRGRRLGTYYLEMGGSVRASKVVYDRAASAFSELKPGDIDWASIFKGAEWFHFAGISPAVSDSAAAVTAEAAQAARSAGLTVSCDLNYRAALWPPERAQKVMRPLMKHVDVLIGGREDADRCLGVSSPNTPGAGGLDFAACEETIRRLRDEFGFSRVGLTLRAGDFADDNDISAVYFDGSSFARARTITLRNIIDRVGGGDAFAAGLIYGNLQKWDVERIVNFGTAANALAHTIHGDFNLASLAEVEAVAKGSGGGRVQR